MALMDELFDGCPLAAEGNGNRAPITLGARLQSALVDFRRGKNMPARFVMKLAASDAALLSPIRKALHRKGKAVLASPGKVLSPGWDAKACFPDKHARSLRRGDTEPPLASDQPPPPPPPPQVPPPPPPPGTATPTPNAVPQATATRPPLGHAPPLLLQTSRACPTRNP